MFQHYWDSQYMLQAWNVDLIKLIQRGHHWTHSNFSLLEGLCEVFTKGLSSTLNLR